MSIQRTIQTGLLIGSNLQTAGLRRQVAQLQHQALAQQDQQNEIATWRQLAFEARKILDSAKRDLQRDPISAVYAIRVAHLSLYHIDDSTFPDLADKQALYQNQQWAADLLAQGESLLSVETAQALHRLAWLHQVQINLRELKAWLEIQQRVRGATLLFIPPPGFVRGFLIFFGGNIGGAIIASLLCQITQPLGIVAYLACNGITLLTADLVLRAKLLRNCNAIAQQAGGWVGSGMRPSGARTLVEQSRARLGSWGYQSRAMTSREAGKELAQVDTEIAQLQQAHFGG